MRPAAIVVPAVLALVAGCPARSVTPGRPAGGLEAPIAKGGTRLVVLVVIDQLPQWSFVEKRPHLTRGFARLLREGEWSTGVYPHLAMLTAPGHALLGTGESPAVTGIAANEWWDRATQKMVYAVEDPAGGVSSARLRVPGLGDAVAAAGRGGKAVAVSLKDRSALLPLGRTGTAIWFDPKTLAFTSREPRPWLAGIAKPALDYAWQPTDPARLAQLSGRRDDEPGEVGDKGFGPTFPHVLARTKQPGEAIAATPLGNDLVFDAAEAALAGEALGTDDVPDLLVVSLSAHDYVGHGWGHESWEAWDLLLRIDARLETFLAALDRHAGAGRWALVVTSDHGAAPLPERSIERTGGGRITYESLRDATNRAAIAELGPGSWIAAVKYPFVWLSDSARAVRDRERAIALRKIMYALRAYPGMEQVGKTADFAGACETRTGTAAAICLAIDPERAGEIFFVPKPGWVIGEAKNHHATAHGSFHDYDRQVPLIVLPPGRTEHAPAQHPGATVPMPDVTAALARWLGVADPRTLPR